MDLRNNHAAALFGSPVWTLCERLAGGTSDVWFLSGLTLGKLLTLFRCHSQVAILISNLSGLWVTCQNPSLLVESSFLDQSNLLEIPSNNLIKLHFSWIFAMTDLHRHEFWGKNPPVSSAPFLLNQSTKFQHQPRWLLPSFRRPGRCVIWVYQKM